MITEFAAAKINLALHVTGRRDDGYHLLDSAVMFAADAGDTLQLSAADTTSLEITGPFSGGLETDASNLVLKAHAALADRFPGKVKPCAMTLTKALPVASGIGGGSADAAAALRGLVRLNRLEIPNGELAEIALKLGADVPVCLASRACRMRGIGEVIDSWNAPPVHAVLVNPLIGVSTAAIFRHLSLTPGTRANAGITDRFADHLHLVQMLNWMSESRNDLEGPARAIEPAISRVTQAMASTPKCGLVRMSGSGATCFGLFAGEALAKAAAADLRARHARWWVVPTRLV